jgi:hypothetical protein
VKKYSLQEWLGKLALTGVLIGLFTVAAFTPEINSLGTGITTPDGIISALNSQSVQPVFTNNVEYINLAEPVNGSISKTPASVKNIVPAVHLSAALRNNQYQAKCIDYAEPASFYYSRQLCLLVDIPPPAYC